MMSFVAPILAKVVTDRMTQNKQATIQTKTPQPDAFEPVSQYNSILRKQLGLLTSKS